MQGYRMELAMNNVLQYPLPGKAMKPGRLRPLLMALGIAGSSIATMVSAWKRRKTLARQAAAMPIPTRELPYRPSRVACRHATRGNGQLVVDDSGDLHFLAAPDNAAKTVVYAGLDLERTST